MRDRSQPIEAACSTGVSRHNLSGVLKYLDGQGVDKAVVLVEYAPKTTGVVTNKFVEEFCRGTERLIPFPLLSYVLPTRKKE